MMFSISTYVVRHIVHYESPSDSIFFVCTMTIRLDSENILSNFHLIVS